MAAVVPPFEHRARGPLVNAKRDGLLVGFH
jgi:hypothetical protein